MGREIIGAGQLAGPPSEQRAGTRNQQGATTSTVQEVLTRLGPRLKERVDPKDAEAEGMNWAILGPLVQALAAGKRVLR